MIKNSLHFYSNQIKIVSFHSHFHRFQYQAPIKKITRGISTDYLIHHSQLIKLSRFRYNLILNRGAHKASQNSPSNSTTKADLLKNYKIHPKRLRGNLRTMKLENEIFSQILTPELLRLNEIFTKYGYEIRLAGGPVRDLLSGKIPADIDFATTATPTQMKEMFEKEGIRMINAKGEEHGTITVRINDKENFEVTTLRIDIRTDGRRAEVEFTKDWELDSGRRDLTINSMFLGMDGTVYDYFNGAQDLEDKKVRFVGNPVDRIQEDYLRILRYFRFFARITENPSNHEEVALDAIRHNLNGLTRISGERIWMEFKKIIQGKYSKEMVVKMLEIGMGPYIGLPQNSNVEEFIKISNQMEKYQLDPQPMTLISALLHDENEVTILNTRLRLSAFERDLCYYVVLHRKRDENDFNSLKYYQSEYIFSTGKTKSADVRVRIEETLKYNGQFEVLEKFSKWEAPKSPVNGSDLIAAKVTPGKSMTLVLERLKSQWIESDFTLTREELLQNLPQIVTELDIKLK